MITHLGRRPVGGDPDLLLGFRLMAGAFLYSRGSLRHVFRCSPYFTVSGKSPAFGQHASDWRADARLIPYQQKSSEKSCLTHAAGMLLFFLLKSTRAIGSGVEHILHTDGVTSSNLVSPTIETKGRNIVPAFLF